MNNEKGTKMMTKFTKELVSQAESAANEVFDFEGKGYYDIVMAKFAELIVQECQRRVEEYIGNCGEIASLPASVIKEYFGVEE
jgi:hypothetical protein